MSRNNLAKSEQSEQLIPKSQELGKKRVRAVHAVLMSWVVEGISPETILAKNASSVQEFVAQLYVKNAFSAEAGSKAALQAAKELRILIDGNDEEGIPMVPVTYVKRLIEDSTGKQTQEQEVQVTVAQRGELHE